ncbi:MAG: hypothetical protein JO083_09020 [Candidatus Eremiobacteraeota bacterium]|nr:hypothetical protein [Candidatus Eremiobacteraeota bacterium]
MGAAIVGLIFVFGLISIARWIWDRLAGLHVTFSANATAIAAWSWFIWFLHDQGAIWLTATATVALWRATAMLTRATNIEHARMGPFLTVALEADDEPTTDAVNSKTADYLAAWDQEDRDHPFLGPRVAQSAARYVSIRVTNEQTTPHGVASNVVLETELQFGAADDVAPDPYTIPRQVGPVMILAGRYVEGPLFNVAGLTNWQMVVRKVEYQDIMKRARSAAVGTGGLRRFVSGNIAPLPRVFEPRKGEYTDAD